jgi:hypothetical protein
VGDGGNDVGMIQAADVGIGIVGREGKQAALAADFSVMQFSFITRLLRACAPLGCRRRRSDRRGPRVQCGTGATRTSGRRGWRSL